MTIPEIMQAIHADLADWVGEHKGTLSVAKDPWNVLELLTQGPAGFLVVLHWAGDDALGEQEQDPLAGNQIDVIVGYNLALEPQPEVALFKPRGTRPALLALVNDCRARVLSMVFPDDHETTRALGYGGAEAVTLPNGWPLAAYKFRVRLDAAVDVDDQREVTP
ncbi:MAG: hypothetical protein WC485_09155 [Opitutaceae bacterium]